MPNPIYNNGLGYGEAAPNSFPNHPMPAATFSKSGSAGVVGMPAVQGPGVAGFGVSPAMDPGMISDVRRRAEGNSVCYHQESVLANNKQTVECHSTPITELVFQGQGDTAMLVGNPSSGLLGTPNSQNQHDEAGTKHGALFSTSRVDVTDDLIAPSSNEPHSKASMLPFEKRCPVWKYIDLEVMPKMSRQPHFRPLEKLPEVLREGIAVGLVVSFEYLSSNKGCLKMDSSCHDLDEYLKRIIDLEAHGFEVQRFRCHLEKMIRVKCNIEQLLQKKSEIKEVILEGTEKRALLNAELEAVDEYVMALKQALNLLQRRKTSLLTQKEESEIMIPNLQRDLRLAAEQLESLEHTFLDLLTGVP